MNNGSTKISQYHSDSWSRNLLTEVDNPYAQERQMPEIVHTLITALNVNSEKAR